MRKKPNDDQPIVRLKPSSYQPTKAEMEEDISINATPGDIARALGRRVRIQYDHEESLEPRPGPR